MGQHNRVSEGAPVLGAVLDDAYKLVRVLGQGGMGTVYEATQLRLNNRVAVKVMARGLSRSPEALARFRREAEVTSAIRHPHIVQVFDMGMTSTGEPFLVMESLPGEDLERRLGRVGRLSPSETLHVIKQVASALAAAHAKGIVHRDLKPANIYLLDAAGERDFVKVLDFGISKARAGAMRLTDASTVMGTPAYMSPEQAQGPADKVDARTDQWALACIAWEALAGQPPFVAEDSLSLLYRVVYEEPPPLMPKQLGLSLDVEDVLRRALAKTARRRFSNVGTFAAALERAIAAPMRARWHEHWLSPAVIAAGLLALSGMVPFLHSARAAARRARMHEAAMALESVDKRAPGQKSRQWSRQKPVPRQIQRQIQRQIIDIRPLLASPATEATPDEMHRVNAAPASAWTARPPQPSPSPRQRMAEPRRRSRPMHAAPVGDHGKRKLITVL